MPGPLDALERMMEEAVEGTVQKLFRPALQPVQLAKAAARAMEEQQIIGPGGPEVPNHYTLTLHPRDFERFARFQLALQRELTNYLATRARDHGWRPVSTLAVVLEVDDAAPLGRPKVLARMLDVGRSAPGRSGPGDDLPIESTVRQARLDRPAAAAPPGPERPALVLVGEAGQRYPLAGPLTRIGRALENDVVIADTRVSRFHAEVRREGDRYLVRDLGSTNGTLVADEPIEEAVLREGDTISLGGCLLDFRTD